MQTCSHGTEQSETEDVVQRGSGSSIDRPSKNKREEIAVLCDTASLTALLS
jgi:hypothetical protein